MTRTSDPKLLIIDPSAQRGGTEEYALVIAAAAAAHGWEVHAAGPRTAGTATFIADLEGNGIRHHPLQIVHVDGSSVRVRLAHFSHLARTAALLCRVRPDVVQVNLPSSYNAFGSILACGLFNIPTVLVFHSVHKGIYYGRGRLLAYAWARKRNQQWVAVSEHSRRVVCDIFQCGPEDVCRIYNGTRLGNGSYHSAGEVAEPQYDVRRELQLPEESYIAITVGRLDPEKGYIDLADAIPHLVADFPNVRFVWVGDGNHRSALVSKVRQCGIEDRVVFTGYRSDVLRLLSGSDLFIFPTHLEGLPLALLEAMAQGLPVVASDTCSIPEIIESGIHGLLFRCGDWQDLLKTIRWALHHPDQMRQMGSRAKQRARDFSEEKMIRETLDLLRSLSHRSPDTVSQPGEAVGRGSQRG